MKKYFYIIIVILCSFFLLTCCQSKKTELEQQQEKIYQLALSAGYTGTYEEWLETIKGVDGTSIKKVEINNLGELIITLSNGKTTNLGNVKGSNGIGIDDVKINSVGELIITYTDGQVKNLGIVKGTNGTNGSNGSDGTGISNIVVNENGELVVTLSDGTIKNLGVIKGKDGQNGQNGENGQNGVGITNIYIDEEGYFIIELSDGSTKNLGKFGSSGSQEEEIVPVYQGMTLESNDEVSTYTIDEKAKARKNAFKESIDDYLDIVTTERVDYYADKGETFNVVVHIYNPQNYEILSFTLNGYKYQSYEFKEGSNSTRLIIEVNAGFVSGLKEYTIDAIKYINGTEIKDVQMDGEKTVKAGVRYEIVPTASIIKEEIGTTSYQSIVEIKDDAKLMDQLTGMHFFIYDGYSIIKHQALSLGLNNIKIEDLAMGSNYQFMVVGVYDDYSGNGKRAVGLIDNEITTLDGYLVDSAISTQSQIKVKLKQLDPSASFKAIDLFKENILLETKEYSSEITFDNLLSNNEYMIKVTYSYLKDGVERISTINFKIKTESKQVPSISLTNFSSSKKEISYQLLESDIDNVKQSFTASLYKDGYLVDETNELVSIFNGLYSNMEYKVVFTYQYDLNDGLGVQTITKEEVIKTKALDTPTLDVKYQVTSTKISYHGILTDIDNTFNSVTYKLYRGDNLIESSSEMTDEFDGLIPNTLYRLVVSYYYDLNDSNPLYNATINYEIETLKQIPTINLSVSNITDNSVKVVTSLNDPNVVGTINSIKLYLNDVLISEKLNNDSDFKELLSNTTYKVVVEASYDLNDGVGSINIEKELSFTTYKKTPSVKIEATSTKKSISYQISYSDVDNIFNLGKVEIIKDNQVVSELSSLTGTVESLNPSTNYIVRVTYSYDVNDGLGVQTITKEEVIKTKA
ncbi:MAG: hypothetical protein ACI32E_00610, partial [Bacilli bacterium]